MNIISLIRGTGNDDLPKKPVRQQPTEFAERISLQSNWEFKDYAPGNQTTGIKCGPKRYNASDKKLKKWTTLSQRKET